MRRFNNYDTPSIEFVREYPYCGNTYYDAIYCSGRVRTFEKDKLPKTVKAFIGESTHKRQSFDKTFNRQETIYSIGR